MDQSTYQKLKEELATKRRRLSKLQDRVSRQLAQVQVDEESLNRVWVMLGNKPTDTPDPSTPEPIGFRAASSAKRGELISTVRRVINTFEPEEDITSEAVRALIDKHFNGLLSRFH
ncbi:MAG: hypothetical protein L0219_16525, partial [Phycisphaerales bacterium]|nr:hypothetical protein [Phycisphaerales bacterium]